MFILCNTMSFSSVVVMVNIKYTLLNGCVL